LKKQLYEHGKPLLDYHVTSTRYDRVGEGNDDVTGDPDENLIFDVHLSWRLSVVLGRKIAATAQ